MSFLKSVKPLVTGVAIAVLTMAALVSGLSWAQASVALREGGEVEGQLDSLVYTLNEQVKEFQSEPIPPSAELVGTLGDAKQLLSAQAESVADLKGFGATADYRATVTEYVAELRQYYEALDITARFNLERAVILSDAFAALGELSDAAEGDPAEEVLSEKLLAAEAAAETATAQLTDPLSSYYPAYSSERLAEMMGALEGALERIRTGVESGDASAVAAGGTALGEVLAADWDSAMFQADDMMMRALDDKIEQLGVGRSEIDDARGALVRWRNGTGFGALVLALLAGVAIAAKWWA